MEKLRFKNFTEIKAIDEARVRKIIRCYKKNRYKVSFSASSEGPGVVLNSILLIRLLTIFGNSKNLERDFDRLDDELFGYLKEARDLRKKKLEKFQGEHTFNV